MTADVTAEPLTSPMRSGVSVARPIFELLRDDAAHCVCAIYDGGMTCSPIAMTVTAADYRRPGRRFL